MSASRRGGVWHDRDRRPRREAHLSRYLREVEAGQKVVITEHGKPIGRIVPVTESTEAQLDTLRQAGLIMWNKQTLQPLASVARVRGERTVIGLLLEDRG